MKKTIQLINQKLVPAVMFCGYSALVLSGGISVVWTGGFGVFLLLRFVRIKS